MISSMLIVADCSRLQQTWLSVETKTTLDAISNGTLTILMLSPTVSSWVGPFEI